MHQRTLTPEKSLRIDEQGERSFSAAPFVKKIKDSGFERGTHCLKGAKPQRAIPGRGEGGRL